MLVLLPIPVGPERRQPAKARFALSELVRAPLAVGDVADDADDANRYTCRVAKDIPPGMDPAQLASFAAKQPVFELVMKRASGEDIACHLFNPHAIGVSSSVQFEVDVDGVDRLSQTFANTTAAMSYFTNHPIDLGSVDALDLGGDSILNIDLTLAVTSSVRSAGFLREHPGRRSPRPFIGSVPGRLYLGHSVVRPWN